MAKFDWISPIKVNLTLFRIIGLWPEGENYKLEIYTLYMLVIISISLFLHTIFYVVEVTLVFTNGIEILVKSLFMALNQTIAFMKCCCFIQNLKRIKRIISNLENDLFQPHSIEQRKKIKPIVRSWKIGQLCFFVIVSVTVVLFLLSPILNKTTNEYKLPFHVWYPWHTKKTPFYEMTYVFQSVCFILRAIFSVAVDTLVAALNTYIAAQCVILCDTLRTINLETNTYEKIKRCIFHHKEILRFASNSNTFYNWIVLGQFFTAIITLALTMFLLSLIDPVSGGAHSVLLFSYLGVVSLELFLYCWFGNEVEIKSSQIPYSAFESDWTGIPIEAKKLLLIFIMRAQKPIKMSAINLFSLSLVTFTAILRTSWSYFAVLRQMNAQD